MSAKSVKSLEEAQASAPEYLEAKDKLDGLLSDAASKAKSNYESLLAPWESLQILVRMLRSWMSGSYPLQISTLVAVVGALIYLVEPFDLVPDGVPVFGLMDDAALIATVAKMNLTAISRFRNWETSLRRRPAKQPE